MHLSVIKFEYIDLGGKKNPLLYATFVYGNPLHSFTHRNTEKAQEILDTGKYR